MSSSRVLVPYHLDEHRPGLDVPFAADHTVVAELSGDDDVWARLAVLYSQVAAVVSASVSVAAAAGPPIIVASGDCTTSLGIVAGLQRAGIAPSVVWLDAHGDVQTLETTTSGYLGGMPLRMLTGYRPELISSRLGLAPVPERDVVLVDARDLDPAEREFLDTSAIRLVGVSSLDADAVPAGPIYLHVDLDVVDAAALPGLLFPVPGGPSLPAVAAAVGRVVDTGRVVAIGLGCTWRPGHGSADAVRPAFSSLFSE